MRCLPQMGSLSRSLSLLSPPLQSFQSFHHPSKVYRNMERSANQRPSVTKSLLSVSSSGFVWFPQCVCHHFFVEEHEHFCMVWCQLIPLVGYDVTSSGKHPFTWQLVAGTQRTWAASRLNNGYLHAFFFHQLSGSSDELAGSARN